MYRHLHTGLSNWPGTRAGNAEARYIILVVLAQVIIILFVLVLNSCLRSKTFLVELVNLFPGRF